MSWFDVCAVCNRQSAGYAIAQPGDAGYAPGWTQTPTHHFCSPHCMEAFFMANKAHIDVTKNEKAAAIAGGAKAGEYLEGIGVTDLAKLSPAQWEAFCATLYVETCKDLARQVDEQVPF